MLKTAIIGLGWWGRYIVGLLKGNPKISLVRAVALDPAAERFALEHGIAFSNDFEAAIDDPGVQALQNAWNAFLADFRQWQAAGWFWNPSRRDELIGYRARFNALLAQWRSVPAVVTAAVAVAGAEPAKGGLAEAVDHVETIVKWGALIVGGAMAIKVASDLGVFSKLGGMLKGRSSSAGGGGVRRYGSARL